MLGVSLVVLPVIAHCTIAGGNTLVFGSLKNIRSQERRPSVATCVPPAQELCDCPGSQAHERHSGQSQVTIILFFSSLPLAFEGH